MTDTDHTSTARESRPPRSRRQFLKGGLATGAGALALGSVSLASGARIEEHCDEQGETDEEEVEWSINDSFNMMDNEWSLPSAAQCIWIDDDGSYGWDWEAGSGDSVGDFDINYPEVYCGTRPWGDDSGAEKFPIRQEDVEELWIEVDVDLSADGGEWDFVEEWWLCEDDPTDTEETQTHEIMLYLDWGGGHGHDGIEQEGAWTDQFDNTVDHWTTYGEGGTDATFHIFKVQGQPRNGKFDLLPIVEYCTNDLGVDSSLYISGIELGNEYWPHSSGETKFNQFDVTINGTTYESGTGAVETTTTTEEETTTDEKRDGPSWPTDPVPTDPDDDELYEDLSGNEKVDFPDVNLLFQNADSDEVEDNVEFYDFDDDGSVDLQDVLALFDMV
ncbi:MAG: twin-arginine translocation signal domain-containing protein [Halococcoides sp.]